MNRPIIVLLDGSQSNLTLVTVARTLADIWHSTIHFVDVTGRNAGLPTLLDEFALERADIHRYVFHATSDPISTIALASGGHSRATVVAFSGTGTEHPAQLSELAERVLFETTTPAVFLRPGLLGRAWNLRSVVVPHDGTPTTSAALRPAAELTHRAAGWLTVVHVADTGVPLPGEEGSMAAPRVVDQPQHEWPAWEHEFLDRLASVCTVDQSRVRLLVRSGKIDEVILRSTSENAADLLVLAWHGAFSGEHGHVVRNSLLSAPCPVMVIRVERRQEHVVIPWPHGAYAATGTHGFSR